MYLFENKELNEPIKSKETEYLLTNGLGSYALGTVDQRLTRKYHGILVTALDPPVNRIMTLSRLCETVTVENTRFELASNDYSKYESSETACLKSFKKDEGVQWVYQIGQEVSVEKTLTLVRGKNAAIIYYKIKTQKVKAPIQIAIEPEFSPRDYHQVLTKGELNFSTTYDRLNETLQINHVEGYQIKLRLKCGSRLIGGGASTPKGPVYRATGQWQRPYYLSNEVERGLETYTHHFVPGVYTLELGPNEEQEFFFILEVEGKTEAGNFTQGNELSGEGESREPLDTLDPKQAMVLAKAHYEELIHKSLPFRSELPITLKLAHEKLSISANDFIAKRNSTKGHTILAGFPWFTDWGRDSMISLFGLTMATGQKDYFVEIFETFKKYMKNGILPNMFPDSGKEPLYNTVDATLWMTIALFRYYEETKDLYYAQKSFLPVLRQIVEEYQKGTLNNTYMDEDGLIWSGDPTTQLTWMDVKVNGWVVTPRHGKAVEINALWYNALKITAFFETDQASKNACETLALKVRNAFNEGFWNEAENCLYDVIRKEEVIKAIRPNQLLAISLPFDLLDVEKTEGVLNKVRDELYFESGIRSLSPKDPDYQGMYYGDVLKRDGAYHRGTGWGWLLGPYLDAYYQLEVRKGTEASKIKSHLTTLLEGAVPHIDQLCLGQYSENFDGNAPHKGRGCMAQAWSVAELLRWLYKLNTIMKGANDHD